MDPELKRLQRRANSAHELVGATRTVLGEMGIQANERSSVVIPLALASMDLAEATFALFVNRTERLWVPAVGLRRLQIEHVMRAAFFAGAATPQEIDRFRRKGKMPKRAPTTPGRDKGPSKSRPISLRGVVTEACGQLGWDVAKLLSFVEHQHGPLSGMVHGGKEILAIYTMHEVWGDLTIPWADLQDEVDNTMVFVQLAMGVSMALSPMGKADLSEVVRPVYESAHAFFRERLPFNVEDAVEHGPGR